MTPAFDKIRQTLRRLPGLGFRSAERIALHLLVEHPERCAELVEALRDASLRISRCGVCGNICERNDDTEHPVCEICADLSRDRSTVCVLEQVPDLLAMEKSGAYRGVYHVLHGKLSPVQGIGPEQLNITALRKRVEDGGVEELILALSNDIEGEATCHYIREQVLAGSAVRASRIGFGLPSGAGIGYADPTTLRSAL
ncbi:MAG: recombination mediator RecR, partial [Opitutales bacterium]